MKNKNVFFKSYCGFWQIIFKIVLLPQFQKNNIYRLQTKLQKGNVFTPVCQSLCSEGCLPSACWGTPPWADTPNSPLGRPPERPLQWMVRILLEYFLVTIRNEVAAR